MLFYIVLFAPVLFWIIVVIGGIGILQRAVSKLDPPKAPPHVETPEEAKASEAWVREMLAQAEKSRLAAHHH